MNLNDSQKKINPLVIIGAAVAVVVLVAVVAAVTGNGKSTNASVPKPTTETPSTPVPTQPQSAIVQSGATPQSGSTPTAQNNSATPNIQYRPSLAATTPMQPGIELIANYSGGRGSQMAQIFKGSTSSEKFDVTTNLEQIRAFALPNSDAQVEVTAIGYILAPTSGDYTISVMETCEESACRVALFLDDTNTPLIDGTSGQLHAYSIEKKVVTPYTVAATLQAGYHKLKVTQSVLRPKLASAGNARVLIKGSADGGLLDALVFLPKNP